jgi:hypothetical protein
MTGAAAPANNQLSGAAAFSGRYILHTLFVFSLASF